MTEKYRHIGKPTPRKDACGIVTGKAQYIDDIHPPKMLYGKTLKSPYPHAVIKNIDTSGAEVHPGVRAVLTFKNVPSWRAGTLPHRRLLDGKVRFVGDGVALVAADTPEIAEEATELISVEYEQLCDIFRQLRNGECEYRRDKVHVCHTKKFLDFLGNT